MVSVFQSSLQPHTLKPLRLVIDLSPHSPYQPLFHLEIAEYERVAIDCIGCFSIRSFGGQRGVDVDIGLREGYLDAIVAEHAIDVLLDECDVGYL